MPYYRRRRNNRNKKKVKTLKERQIDFMNRKREDIPGSYEYCYVKNNGKVKYILSRNFLFYGEKGVIRSN